MKDLHSKVRVWQAKIGGGYFIEVKDDLTLNRMAVTKEELKMIVEQGIELLEEDK